MKPISPNSLNPKTIPDEVIKVFNHLIESQWDGYRAVVSQKDAVALIVAQSGMDEDVIFDKKLLDVEKTYRDAGWKVEYHQPAYAEDNFESYFVFKKP